MLPRLFGNRTMKCKKNGTIAENGCGKMNFFDCNILDKIKKLGVTHVWYTGIIRHASVTDYSAFGIPRQHPAIVKGKAGSPYAITDYYDVDPDLAENIDDRMDEFEALVERTHNEDLSLIIDFVPNHVARQYHSIAKLKGVKDLGEGDNNNFGFSPRNNFYYCVNEPFAPYIDLYAGSERPYMEFPAKVTGNDCFNNRPCMNDWYETVKLNYGVDYCDAGGRSSHFTPIPDTWFKMVEILLFWAKKGIDGFRCDMAEMVPHEFWTWAIHMVKESFPHIMFIAEVYNPSEYRNYISSGFDYLYDKVGMYDTMRGVICGNTPCSSITYAWQSVDDIHDKMLYFLENHDEQRIASNFFSGSGTKALPGVIVNALMRANPFMIYAGQEYGEKGMNEEGFSGRDGRTTIFDYWTVISLYHGFVHPELLDKDETSLRNKYSAILNLAISERAVSEGIFFDLEYANPHLAAHQYSFIRKADDELLLVVANFSVERVKCDVCIPEHAFDMLNIQNGTYEASDILNDKSMSVELSAVKPITFELAPYWGVVLKFLI